MQIVRNGKTLELVQGDITEQACGAIVNAANAQLTRGTGVNGAIQSRGGPAIFHETSTRYPAGCPTGSAVITGSGDLPAKYVIHAVGPVWEGGDAGEPELLAGAYRKSLELANDYARQTIALPALSTGVFGYPLPAASQVAIRTVLEHLDSHRYPQLARFVLFDDEAFAAFTEALRAHGEVA